MEPAIRIIAGAMSGTSADGVDVALVRITGHGLDMSTRLLGHHHEPYVDEIKTVLFACRNNGNIALADLAMLGRNISLTYARAVNAACLKAHLQAHDLAAIAAHGQTLYHHPPDTIQWLDPSLLAAETGVAVVSDFRRADCAAGGQGAPLVPFADHLLFSNPAKHRVLLNLGGIANITFLPAGGSIDSLIAFDTGPANCISDFLMQQMHPEGPGVDVDGVLASHGQADEAVVLNVLNQPFFRQPPPRSTDGPAMIDLFFSAIADPGSRGRLPSHLATACLLSAAAVARSIRDFLPSLPDEVIVSGGGVRNQTLMRCLREQLAHVPIISADRLGINGDAKEAIAFALLGAATLDNQPSNVPAASGASRRVVLGSITPRPFT